MRRPSSSSLGSTCASLRYTSRGLRRGKVPLSVTKAALHTQAGLMPPPIRGLGRAGWLRQGAAGTSCPQPARGSRAERSGQQARGRPGPAQPRSCRCGGPGARTRVRQRRRDHSRNGRGSAGRGGAAWRARAAQRPVPGPEGRAAAITGTRGCPGGQLRRTRPGPGLPGLPFTSASRCQVFPPHTCCWDAAPEVGRET